MRMVSLALGLLLGCMATSGCHIAATGHNLQGKRMFQQGQYVNALESFQKAVADDPKNADAYYNMAATFHRMGTESGNQQYLNQAEMLYHQCLDVDSDHVDCHRGLAVLLAETNRSDQAFQLLRSWAGRSPTSPEPLIELARLYKEFGDSTTSRELLVSALQNDYRNARAFRGLGQIQEEMGDPMGASSLYLQAYNINSLQPDLAPKIAKLRQQGGVIR